MISVNRRAIVLALAAFAAVLAPATESHASGLSFAFATPPQVTTPGTFSSAITALASVDGNMTIDVTALQLHRRTRVVDLTNAQRAASGLGALTVNADLQRSAQRYVNHLAADGAFSHTDGSVLGTRVTQAGYVYTFVGENLALGQTSPRGVVAAWMASPEHRANMLDGRFTEMGVGVARRSDGRILWCIDFGWPKA